MFNTETLSESLPRLAAAPMGQSSQRPQGRKEAKRKWVELNLMDTAFASSAGLVLSMLYLIQNYWRFYSVRHAKDDREA
ncbi:hypothetical protein RRG08_042581 [Elysia crispata]|uniref:Uncharacterized protein n=1 Tax=Elysia crispata TaxID=231223 RepID=A0AAE1CKC6_9GAST|nr:hypothetical protein RRG08_042581 [Elysia crispata]